MYKKVLLAYDGSIEGRRALREGAKLAQLCRAEVFLLAVVEVSSIMTPEAGLTIPIELQTEDYKAILNEGSDRLKALGFSPTSRLEVGDAGQKIAEVAEEIGAHLVVVGHRPQGPLARWFGSVGSYLVKRLRCSVLVGQTEIGDDEFERLNAAGGNGCFRLGLVRRRARFRYAGTMILPIGHSAMPASLRCAQANGMPMMVTASTTAVTTCASASHHPASISQMMLPISTERSGADIRLAAVEVTRHRFEPERKQRVSRDVERGPRPGQADDRNRHDDGGDQPAERHPCAAERDPENIQKQRDRRHGSSLSCRGRH